MSTRGLFTAAVRRLWPTMRKHARRLGRWLIKRLVVAGAERLGHYVLERAAFLRNKAAKFGGARRARLLARSNRWATAGRWLLRRASDLSVVVADAFDRLADRLAVRIPVRPALERA